VKKAEALILLPRHNMELPQVRITSSVSAPHRCASACAEGHSLQVGEYRCGQHYASHYDGARQRNASRWRLEKTDANDNESAC
jgi:hypothetical protein